MSRPTESDTIRSNRETALLSPRELLRHGVETERLETIKLASVLTDESLTDQSHSQELGESMKGTRGQLTPIAVRARLGERGEIVYDIIDGFHRTEGKKSSGDEEINATVLYGLSDEELFDYRILAASSVRSVQFPRIAKWIEKSYATTPFLEKGISVAQAFGIALNDKSDNADLSRDEKKRLKDWVEKKCTRWDKTVSAMHGILKIVEASDPELVKDVRTATGGKERSKNLTQTRLQVVAFTYPGQEHFAMQRALIQASIDRRLGSEQTKALIQSIKSDINPGMSEAEIYELARNARIKRPELPVLSWQPKLRQGDQSREQPANQAKPETTQKNAGAAGHQVEIFRRDKLKAEQQAKDVKKENLRLQARVDRLTQDKQGAQQQVTIFGGANAELREQVDRLTREKQQREGGAQVARLEAEKARLQQQIGRLTEDKRDAQQQVTSLQRANARLQEQIQDLSSGSIIPVTEGDLTPDRRLAQARETIALLREQNERLQTSHRQIWWEWLPGLTDEERTVAKANAHGVLGALQRSMPKERIQAVLEGVTRKYHTYLKEHPNSATNGV